MSRAGDLRERMTFQARAAVDDGVGNPVSGAWQDRCTVWASLAAKMGTETVTASRMQGEQPYILTVRQSSDTRAITTDWRAVDAHQPGRIYNIRAIADPDGRRTWLELLVVEGAPT